MADTATLEARLAQAEAALHDLLVGRKAVQLDYDGRRTAFAPSDEAKLRQYIQELKAALGRPGARRRAIGVSFG